MTRLDPWFRHAFAAETYRLLHAFASELRATTGAAPPAAPILLASELLLVRHGNHASWRALEPAPFLETASAALPSARPHEHKAVLVAFLAFLARAGVVDDGLVHRAELAPLPCHDWDELETPADVTLPMPSLDGPAW